MTASITTRTGEMFPTHRAISPEDIERLNIIHVDGDNYIVITDPEIAPLAPWETPHVLVDAVCAPVLLGIHNLVVTLTLPLDETVVHVGNL